MKQTKTTKNKYLRRLVRDYEIERKRPKGLKYLDMFIKQIPETVDNTAIFVSRTIHKECDLISKYKGYNIYSATVIRNTQAYACNESNIFYK